MMYQDLSKFCVPENFRGRSKAFVQLWWLVQATLFRCSPQVAYGFRRTILRIFGAKVGEGVLVRPSVRITYPWKVTLGDYCWIGDNVNLYSLGPITIGKNAVVSQESYLCTGDHDYSDPAFAIRAKPITVGPEAWVAAGTFIAPGVSIGQAAVIGARSFVFSDMPAATICYGSPCAPARPRMAASLPGSCS
ncbi:putative colanic acid biosynthesis acetyltransferase [Cupriavidus sp. BIC8F]|uniref:putative colanic acid biosynthesis acetyltransferase n=1 Tax=Cupriavidus sp. BIC8F TaxID=3079014 RepID=UPI002916D34F|nr:putative colanic acid biosynthesis acetyltransferase [Cupriavidus sp. BIC8F]